MNKRKRSAEIRIRGEAGKATFSLFMAVYAAICAISGAKMADGMAVALRDTGMTEEVIQAGAQSAECTAPALRTAADTCQLHTEHTLDVPSGDTAFKSYMSWRTITNKESYQYKLQKRCWTDANGLRRYKTYYVVALGSYYTDHIGERFRITTDDGSEFECVVGDFKADRHTDALNQYTPMDGRKCVVEFVVDMNVLDKTAKRMGDISYIEGFSGNIESIEKEAP